MFSNEEIKMFIYETENHIKKSERELLKFEENPKDKKPLEQLYYSFQALKALSPMLGLTNLSKYCYFFESQLEKAKDMKTVIKKVREFTDMIFNCLDILKSVLDRAKKGDIKDIEEEFLIDQKEIMERIRSEYEITFIKPLDLSQIEAIINERKNFFYRIEIKIQETCKFKKVRLYIIFRALNKIGQICWSNPEPMILENAEFELEFEIFFISQKNRNDINDILEEILEIEKKTIKKINSNDFKKIITNYTLKWQKAMEKMIKLRKSTINLKRDYEITFIYPITLEEYETIMSDKTNIFYYIYICIELACKNKKARLYIILKTLDQIGHICWSNPEPNVLEKGGFKYDFELYFISKTKQKEILQNLEKISEINSKIIKKIKPLKFKDIVTIKEIPDQKEAQESIEDLIKQKERELEELKLKLKQKGNSEK